MILERNCIEEELHQGGTALNWELEMNEGLERFELAQGAQPSNDAREVIVLFNYNLTRLTVSKLAINLSVSMVMLEV